MELSQVLQFLDAIPVFVWILGGLVILFLFGDRKFWELEAKFPLKQGVGRGEIEIESFKKSGTRIEAEFKLEADYRGKPIEIFVADELALSIPAARTHKEYLRYERAYSLKSPSEGDAVVVRIDGVAHFNAVLVID